MRPATLVKDAAELTSTIVTAHLGEPHAPGKSLVFCATFQLAWNELAEHVGAPVILSPPSPLADALNSSPINRAILDEPSFVARAGYGADGIEESIRREISEKFGPDEADKAPIPSVAADAFLAFAYLVKSLAYASRFDYEPAGVLFGGRPVAAFGVFGMSTNHQIGVHDYTGPDDFVIELFPKLRDDRILVAKIAPGATLETTIASVRARLGKLDALRAQHGLGERVAIPCLNFSITRAYNEINHRRIENPAANGRLILGARQGIKFKFDDEGAVLVSYAAIPLGFGSPPPRGSRTFICDKPFLLLLVRADAEIPYFAMWVDNQELLVPSEDPSALPPPMPPRLPSPFGPPQMPPPVFRP